MSRLFRKVTDLDQPASQQQIARSTCGMIEAAGGQLQFVQIRPWPKLVSGVEALCLGGWWHRRVSRDRVQIWYHQPVAHRNFLTLSYELSALGTSLATIRSAHRALDRVAEIKRSDAILCHVTNRRITDRVMRFYGFERHVPGHRRGRHYIRRFYGEYPTASGPGTRDAASTRPVALPVVTWPTGQGIPGSPSRQFD